MASTKDSIAYKKERMEIEDFEQALFLQWAIRGRKSSIEGKSGEFEDIWEVGRE